MAQNPWDAAPVVKDRSAASAPRYETISSSYTNETPEDLRAQGYEQDDSGTWFRVVGTAQRPAQASGANPWDQAPVATESQLRAGEVAAQRVAAGDGLNSGGGALMQGLLLGFADEIGGGVAGLGQMASNAIRTATGRPIEIESADLRDAQTRALRGEQDRFSREQPIANFGLQAAGGLLTGGGTVGSGIRGALATGALYGGAYGAGTAEGGLVERAPEAALGAVAGGALGGAVQGAATVAAPYAQRLAGIAGNINPGGAARAATRRAGPEAGAATRLSQQITPDSYAERARLQALGVDASVLDVIGGTGERMIRSAAGPAGPGADMAVQNAVTRTANLKPEISNVTRGLSQDPRTATQFREGLEETRSALATEQYAPAYETPVAVTPEILSAISDEPGRAALRRARAAAVARRDLNQVTEIDGLLNGETGEISAGTLDRVRIAMAGRARDLNQRPGSRDIAGGLFERSSDIDSTLANVPELAPARETYRDLSGAIENIDPQVARAVFNTDPVDFQSQVSRMTPTQRDALVVSVRQEIMDALGKQRDAGTGSLQNISEATYSRENLATLLGEAEAARYIDRIREGVQQAQRANRVSPNTNSQTFGRQIDDQTFNAANMVGAAVDVGQAATGNGFAIARTIDRLAARATLSPQEREAIVRLGLGSADELERIVALAQQARSQGRPPPREVRAWIDRSRNVLGSQSPVAQQIEMLLLPSRVSAEEEQ